MTVRTLSFQPGSYGSWATASAIADFWEHKSLVSRRALTAADLADALSDADVTLFDHAFTDSSSEQQLDSIASADRVYALLRQRSKILTNALYPFKVEDDKIAALSVGTTPNAYLGLLGMTLVHHGKLAKTSETSTAFEKVVGQAWKASGWESFTFKANAGIRANLRGMSTALKLPYNTQTLTRGSKDEKVDCVCKWPWDARAGAQVVLTQTTIGGSDTWHTKIGEPRPMEWMLILNDIAPPTVCLAVPHHVEDWVLEKFRHTGTVLDRLRLCSRIQDHSPIKPFAEELRTLVSEI